MYSTEKKGFEFLEVSQFLPNLILNPLLTTHIEQELWTYKKGKTFSMTPTEA
jgi:hypothetical protein